MAGLQSPPGARPARGYDGDGAGATRGADQSAILIGLVPLLPPLFSPWPQFAPGPPSGARPAHPHDSLSVLSGADRRAHSRYRLRSAPRPSLITPE